MPNLILLSQLLPPFVWISLSAVLFTSADILFRFWYQSTTTLYFLMAFCISAIGIFCLSMSFPYQNIAVATVVCILINIALYLIFAFLIFGDIITIKQSIGLLIGFTAIFILEGMK